MTSQNPGSIPEMLAALKAKMDRENPRTDAEIDAEFGPDNQPEEEN